MGQAAKTYTIAFEGDNTSLMLSIDKVTSAARKLRTDIASITLSNPSGDPAGNWVAKLKLVSDQAQRAKQILEELKHAGESLGGVSTRSMGSTDSELKRRNEAFAQLLLQRNEILKTNMAQEEALMRGQVLKVAQLQAQKDAKFAQLKAGQETKAAKEKFVAGTLSWNELKVEIDAIKARERATLQGVQLRLRAEENYSRQLKEQLATQAAVHKQQGETLIRQWREQGAEHKRRGEELMRQYLKENADAREAHRRRGEELMQAYKRDNVTVREEHRRRGEIIAQEYARQNALTRELEQTRLGQFGQFLRQREAMLRADIATQRQVEINGMNSIEAHRAAAQRERLVAEQAYRNRIAVIESSVRGGTQSSVGQTQAIAAMNQYLQALQKVDAQLGVHERAVQKTDQAHHSMWVRVAAVSTIYGLWTSAIHRTSQALLSVPTTGIHFEGTKAGLQAVTGSASGAYREMAFLNHEANRTGMALDGLRSSFRLFAASAVTSGESMKTVEGIFANVNTMATTLHLSADDVNGIFLALGQTFNKGKLQSEELVKQLAQRVSGVVPLMAKAYAKAGESVQHATTRLLNDMKMGTVAAHENLAKLGEEMAKQFGGEAFAHASTGLNAAIGRLETSWTHLTENIYKATANSMMNILGFTTGGIEALSKMSDDTRSLEASFNAVGYTIRNFVGIMAAAGVALAAYKVSALPVVQMFGVWRAAQLGLNAAIMASPVAILSTLAISLGAIVGKLQAIKEERAALEKLAFAPTEAHRTPAQEFSYKIDEDPRVKELNFALEAAKRNVDKYSATVLGFKVAPEELKRAEATYAALWDKMILKRREVAEELKKQANLGNVTDDSLIEETQYDRSARHNAKAMRDIEERIGTINKRKQLEIDTLNERAKIEEARTGKVVDAARLEHQTLEVTKKYHAQINALIAEKSRLTTEGESKTVEAAGKSITAFDKLVKIMRTMESKGREDAVSPVGAVGRHQVMPSTLAHGNYGDRVQGIPEGELQTAISYEMVGRRTRRMSPQMYAYLRSFAVKYADKIADFGVNELRKNYEHFGNDASKALAAYNAGRGTVERLVRTRGANWASGLLPETANYIREGVRLGAPKMAGELDKYESQRVSIRAQAEEQAILAQKEALTAEGIMAQREKARRLEAEKLAEQQEKNKLVNEELQMETDGLTQNQLAVDLAKIQYDFDKKKFELEKAGNTEGIALLTTKTQQLRVQANLAEAGRKSARAASLAELAEKDLNMRRSAELITEAQYDKELMQIRLAQIPALEEELKLTEQLTKEEDRRLATLTLQAKIKELRQEPARNLDFTSVAGKTLEEVRKATDRTNTDEYRAQQQALAAGQADELNRLTAVGGFDRDGQLQTHESFLKQKNDLDAKYADANFVGQMKYYSGLSSLGAETFQGITGHMTAMYGAQSKQAKIAFVAYKAFMVAQTVMNTAAAVVAQLTQPWGIPLAAMAAATGAMQIAKIIAEPMPQAHGGLEYVPEDATYALKKGERVLAPNQNEAFMKLNQDLSVRMNREAKTQGKPPAPTPTVVKPQIKVVNIDYSSQELDKHLKSTSGEEIIINHLLRNKELLA